MDLGLMKFLLIPFNICHLFSHSVVKKHSYHSCLLLPVLCKVKLLLLIFLFLCLLQFMLLLTTSTSLFLFVC